jgi:hypothetical protein
MSLRGGAFLSLVMCVGLALAGCTGSPSETGMSTESPPPPSAAAERNVDLTRLAAIGDAFPPGYPAGPLYGPRTRDAQASRAVGDHISYDEAFTVEPDSCRTLLDPVKATEGAETAAVSSETGPTDPFISVSVDDPVVVPTAIPDSGCDRFSFAVEGAIPDGTVERLRPPSIDGATTYAMKIMFTAPEVEYVYNAILDGRTFVTLWARVPSDFSPEPVLPDLLTKAVTSLRGQ